MATTQVIDLLLQDGSDYESTVGIVGILYATVAAHAGAAYKRTPPQKTRARRLTGSLSPLGWHFSLPEYRAVHWVTPSPWGAGGLGLCIRAASQLLHPLMLGFRGDQSHNSGRPLPLVGNKRSREKDKHGDVSSQYVL
mgnify:CR=1 FL=1